MHGPKQPASARAELHTRKRRFHRLQCNAKAVGLQRGNWPQATKRWMRARHLIALVVIVVILILIILIVLQQKKLAGQAD